jgi:hypothetical protein
MKKITFLFLIVGSLLIGTTLTNASNDGVDKNRSKTRFVSCEEQTTQINELIGNPGFIKGSVKADIVFNMNEFNIITVSDVKTENEALKKYIYQKLNGKRIQGNEVEMLNQKLSMRFTNERDKTFLVF